MAQGANMTTKDDPVAPYAALLTGTLDRLGVPPAPGHLEGFAPPVLLAWRLGYLEASAGVEPELARVADGLARLGAAIGCEVDGQEPAEAVATLTSYILARATPQGEQGERRAPDDGHAWNPGGVPPTATGRTVVAELASGEQVRGEVCTMGSTRAPALDTDEGTMPWGAQVTRWRYVHG